MTRVLVLEGVGLVIPDGSVETIEAVEPTTEPGLWLPSVVQPGAKAGPNEGRRRLRLDKGGSVEVPVGMRFVDDIEILELPELLRHIAEAAGVVGLAQLPDGLVLVCDPNLLSTAEDRP